MIRSKIVTRGSAASVGIMLLVLLAAGCAGSSAEGGPDASASPSGRMDPVMPMPEDAPSAADETFGTIGRPGDPKLADRSIEVRATDALAFEPASIRVAEGETVKFVIVNTGEVEHEFVLGDEQTQSAHSGEMNEMPGGTMPDEPNAVSLFPGEKETLTWTFDTAGTVEFACHVNGHYEAGMKGTVDVQTPS